MTVYAVDDAAAAGKFIESVALPAAPAAARAGLESNVPPTGPVYQPGAAQAVAIGSQIAEYAANMPAHLRPHISNSLLLAQLAANSYLTTVGGGSKEWYDRYAFVLANSGWIVETSAASTRDVSGASLQVHKEIIPIVAAALGPAVAAAAIVTATLNGLANMAKDSPWITLFSRESQRARANQFQIGYASAPAGGDPAMSLACFELDAQRSVTQVLFFKFSDSSASLRYFTAKLTMNTTVFTKMQPLVEARIAEHVSAFITGIDLK